MTYLLAPFFFGAGYFLALSFSTYFGSPKYDRIENVIPLRRKK